ITQFVDPRPESDWAEAVKAQRLSVLWQQQGEREAKLAVEQRARAVRLGTLLRAWLAEPACEEDERGPELKASLAAHHDSDRKLFRD
ncbi:MAG: hypothetical protein ACRD1G_04875, partial [Acidimicrobiales bacterium]